LLPGRNSVGANRSTIFLQRKNEKRMLIKQLFNTPADLIALEKEKTLTIKLTSLSALRYNEAITQYTPS